MEELGARGGLERDGPLTTPRLDPPRRSALRYWPLAAVGALALGVALLLRGDPPAAEPTSSRVVRPAEPAVVEPAAVPAVANPEQTPPTIAVASDKLPLMPHDPREPVPEGPVHPHAHTPTHERIYRENNLLGSLNGAMDVKDAAGMRRLLESYREEYPEDPHALQEGYALIADCLEHPDEATIERARRYYAAETASTLRRYVRRHCFQR